jgi:hypothetical protein
LNQFSRSIGAAVGVAVMGAILARGVSGLPLPGAEAASSAMLLAPAVRLQFFAALHRVFIAGALVSLAGLVGTLFLPRVDFGRGVPPHSGEELLAAEMANLEPQDEPVAVIE